VTRPPRSVAAIPGQVEKFALTQISQNALSSCHGIVTPLLRGCNDENSRSPALEFHHMKQSSGQNVFRTKVLLAGAALTALVCQSRAQSSDALIDMLLQKGILTAGEAKDLREEADNDFQTAFQTKTGMPDWVTGYKLYGSFRGRFEQFSTENNAGIDRTRLRYRLLFGVTANLQDNLEAGFRLGSGDPKGIGSSLSSSSGNPLSQNSTEGSDWSDKNIYVDLAYGKWTMANRGDWQLAATVGKMENPFNFTWMVFDPDLTPEGGALTGSYTINDRQNFTFAAGAFVLAEIASTTHDPFLYGGQILWNAKWTPKLSTSIGGGAFQIVSHEELIPGVTVPVTSPNQGNFASLYPYYNTNSPGTVFIGSQDTHYTPLIADASVTYTLDSFPFYAGAFPIKFTGEYMNNAGANANNNGFWLGVTLGKSGTKKTWDITYRYEYLEANAWYDQLVDDDNVGYYATVNYPSLAYPSAGVSKGWVGGTNVKGHMIKFNYSITDSLTFSATCYLNDLILLPQQVLLTSPAVRPVDLNGGAIHFMADLTWKF
jgi:hypothetical protein